MPHKEELQLSEVRIESERAKRREKTRRASADQVVENAPQARADQRLTQSQRTTRRKPPAPTIAAIPEAIEEDTRTDSALTLNAATLSRTSSHVSSSLGGITKKGIVRESGRSTRSAASTMTRGSDGDILSNNSRYSSNQSLSTYKEQYCCNPNGTCTPRERKLCASVAVLATVIVILVAVVGYLADRNDDNRSTFFWKF